MSELPPHPETKKSDKRWFSERLSYARDEAVYVLKNAGICGGIGALTTLSLLYLGITQRESFYAGLSVSFATRLEQNIKLVPRSLDYMEHLLFH